MDFDYLFRARKYLTVSRHEAGSLKLKVNPAILGDPALKNIPKPDSLPNGILDVNLSVFTMSVSLKYDTAVIPEHLVDELFTTQDENRGKELVAELARITGVETA